MAKTLRIDIYADIDETDVGSELELEVGDIRCPATGELYTGTFVIKDLKCVGHDNINEKSL